jgi:uncharacterized protein DUF4112
MAPDTELRVARTVTRVLDGLYLDPILGFFVPGAGDVLTGAASLYLVALGVRLKMPPVVIARMLLNVAIDVGVGMIPVAGDLFDVVWKSNQKNLALLESRQAAARRASAGDWLVVAGAGALVVVALAAPIVLLVYTLRAIFSW